MLSCKFVVEDIAVSGPFRINVAQFLNCTKTDFVSYLRQIARTCVKRISDFSGFLMLTVATKLQALFNYVAKLSLRRCEPRHRSEG